MRKLPSMGAALAALLGMALVSQALEATAADSPTSAGSSTADSSTSAGSATSADPSTPLVGSSAAAVAASGPVTKSRPAASKPGAAPLSPEASLIFGEEPSKPSGPAPRTADGHPDLSGFWKGTRATTPVGNIGKDLPGFRLPLTAAGKAALQHNLTATIDPEALCIIGGIPRHSASALPFQIVQNGSSVVFLYMYTYFRAIPVGERKHTPDPDPTFFGDKIGWWEGDTFVIDSTGFKDTPIWIDENANPQSDAMHAVERWTRPDVDHVHLDLTVDDSKFYTHPFKYSRTWVAGKPGEGLREYSCSENNVDRDHIGPGPGPIRQDGTRGYDVPPLPDVPPSPEAYGIGGDKK